MKNGTEFSGIIWKSVTSKVLNTGVTQTMNLTRYSASFGSKFEQQRIKMTLALTLNFISLQVCEI